MLNLQEDFSKHSVTFLSNMFSPTLCNRAISYLLENEKSIIAAHSTHSRGISFDNVLDGRKLLKYFEFPLYENAMLYGEFLSSDIFKTASSLLQKPVRLVSSELHSRCAGGTIIPIHQDNAYYGLKDGNAITAYIALNDQRPEDGGLRYYSNPVSNQYHHSSCDVSGFSLTINDSTFDLHEHKEVSFSYSAGDCTFHHSRSVHSASIVPSYADRALVFRMSFYAVDESKIEGHDKWYDAMVRKNRELR